MAIQPYTGLQFHSHYHGQKQKLNVLTIQIPIVVPKGFTYMVAHDSALNENKDVINKNKITHHLLKPGRAYIFNSYAYHNVYNSSYQNRYTIMFYALYKNLNCKKLIKNYNKELLEYY